MRALRQTFVLPPATKVAVDRSVVQPPTNFIYIIKSTHEYVQNMFHHMLLITNMFQISLVIIIGVALQEYEKNTTICHIEYWEPLKCYNKCIKH
jgi:hypothetical protein